MNVLFILLFLFSIPLVLALFGRKTYTIQREVIIHQPAVTVFNYIRLLRNQENYSKWVMTDPAMKKGFVGTDGETGFIYSWDSDNSQVGKGSQEITRINNGKLVECEVRFIKPFKGIATNSMVIEQVDENSVTVSWALKGSRNYVMRLIHLVLNLEKVLGKDIQTSLNTLKTILENEH